MNDKPSGNEESSKRLILLSAVLLGGCIVTLFVVLSKNHLTTPEAIENFSKSVTDLILKFILSIGVISWLVWESLFRKKKGYGLLTFSVLSTVGTVGFVVLSFQANKDSAETKRKSFENAVQSGVPTLKEIFSLRARLEYAVGEFLKFMRDNFGKYILKKDSISFRTKELTERYVYLKQKISEIEKAQLAFQDQQLKKHDSLLRQVKDLAR